MNAGDNLWTLSIKPPTVLISISNSILVWKPTIQYLRLKFTRNIHKQQAVDKVEMRVHIFYPFINRRKRWTKLCCIRRFWCMHQLVNPTSQTWNRITVIKLKSCGWSSIRLGLFATARFKGGLDLWSSATKKEAPALFERCLSLWHKCTNRNKTTEKGF